MNTKQILHKSFRYILLLVLLNGHFALLAQTSNFKSWNGINLEYDIKKFNFGFEQEIRLDENASQFDQYFTNLSLGYELIKNLNLEFEYRFIISPNNVTNEKFSRYAMIAEYKIEPGRFSIGSRIKYQLKDEILYEIGKKDPRTSKLRARITTTYNVPDWKLDPKIGIELFQKYQPDEEAAWNKYRFILGTKYKFTKKQSISASYFRDTGIGPDNGVVYHILALNYLYKL